MEKVKCAAMPRHAIKIVEITELPSAEAAVHPAPARLARPNRALADALAIEHQVSHELLVSAAVRAAPTRAQCRLDVALSSSRRNAPPMPCACLGPLGRKRPNLDQ